MTAGTRSTEWWKETITAMAAKAEGNAFILARLAKQAADNDLGSEAYDLAVRARALAPDDAAIHRLTAPAISAGVPSWHFVIVHDAKRNAAYRAALEQVVRPGDRVLDIGAGTGLLSMMAARAGAEVVACEMNPAVADAARRIVAQNGFAERIRIVGKHSEALDLDEDLGGPVDVIVSEIVSNTMLGEFVLPVMADVVPRLLKPGGRVIPERGSARLALCHWAGLEQRRMGVIDGFDLSGFNGLENMPRRLSVGNADLVLRSAPADIFTFDFASGGPYSARTAQTRLVAEGGPANGIVQWIHLDLVAGHTYENAPAPGTTSCWACLFHPLPAPVTEGTPVRVEASHDQSTISIWGMPD